MGISPDAKTVYITWINANGTKGTFNDLVMIAKSTDGGNTFEKGVPVDAANPACSCCKVNMAVDNNGDIYTSWRKLYPTPNETSFRPLDNKYEYRQIVVAKSTDGAKTFSTPVKVYDDKFLTNQCVMSGPQMAIDSKNNLHIVWYTGSNTTGFTPGSYYAVSSDGGKSFGKPIPIVTSSKVGPSVEHLAIDSNNTTWITWDDRNGQNNTMWMYYTLPPTKLGIAKVTPDGHMTKTLLDVGNGKLPLILASGDKVGVIWNTNNGIVKYAPIMSR